MADTSPAVGPRVRAPSRRHLIFTVLLVLAVAGIGALALVHRSNLKAAAPATQTRDEFMGLTAVGGLHAPAFSFSDQTGRTVTSAGLQRNGQVVVLEFMDSHCTDICPIISQEFVAAHQALGADAGRVAFVAVNVNPFHATRADVAAFTDNQGLNRVPEWHFLTGSVPALQRTWKAYGIAVQAPSPTADVVHSDNMYFIDATGHERWLASPNEDHTADGTPYLPAAQVHQWGRDIAAVARQLVG